MFTTARSRMKLLIAIPVVLMVTWTAYNLVWLTQNNLSFPSSIWVCGSIALEAALLALVLAGIVGYLIGVVTTTLVEWVNNGK